METVASMQPRVFQAIRDEYSLLRDEIATNRKFVFERPLAIVGATFVAALGTLAKVSHPEFLSFPFLGALAFNLWFTSNRLYSNARIVAYLQLVHEGEEPYRWVGWEQALRLFRVWLKNNPKYKDLSPSQEYDNTVFYTPIFYFHLAMGVLLALYLILPSDSLARVFDSNYSSLDLVAVILNAAALACFLFAATRFRPEPHRRAIEQRLKIWELVFKENGLEREGLREPVRTG